MVGEVWTYQQVWSAASRAASHLLEMAKIRLGSTHVGMMLAGEGVTFLDSSGEDSTSISVFFCEVRCLVAS